MRRALGDYVIGGIRTNLSFLSRLIADPDFGAGNYDIGFVQNKLPELLAEPALDPEARLLIAAAAAVAAREAAEAERAAHGSPSNGMSPWVSAQRSALKW